jgi:hypothetical protein
MRYRLTGIDDEGDRHTFETDDEERAKAMLCLWQEDFTEVNLLDVEST